MWLAIRLFQPKGVHFLGVAHQQDIAHRDRMVPGFALDCRDPGEFGEPVGDCGFGFRFTGNCWDEGRSLNSVKSDELPRDEHLQLLW